MIFRFISLLFVVGFLSACSTISPDLPIPSSASANHSGIYAYSLNKDGSLRSQWWLEQHRENYNILIKDYGTLFSPTISADDSLIKDGSHWKANAKARAQYIEMREKKREAKGL